MKKAIVSFIVLMAAIVVKAQDYDVELGGVYYKCNTSTLMATVVQAPYDTPYSGDITIPVSITRGRYSFDVTEVANQAFSSSNLTSVTFLTDGNKGVSSIGDNAFSYSKQLTAVTLPNTLTTLGARAFIGCKALKEITIPDGVSAINDYTFTDCSSLETVYLPVTMSNMAIGESAFSNSGITTITLPKGVQATGEACFSHCKKLHTVNFPDDWLFINAEMFTDCTSLNSITLPESLRGIMICAFFNCPLKSLNIPANVEYFHWNAVTDCPQLKNLRFEDGIKPLDVMESAVESYELEALETLYVGRKFTDTDEDVIPPSLKELTIGENVSSLPYSFGNALQTIHSKIVNPASVSENFTSRVKGSATLYVPKGTYNIYCNATGWKQFFDIEEEENGNNEPLITVTADDKTVEYGEVIPKFTYTVEGGTLEGKPDISTVARQFSDVGNYPISLAKGTITYQWVYFINGTLTITKAPLTVGVQDITITEGDDIPAFTLIYTGFKGTQTESVLTTLPVASTTATSSSPAGTYTITVKGGKATNYSLNYESGTLTILKKQSIGTTELGYSFNETNKTATVIAKEGETYEGEITIPQSVEKDGVTYKVTTIGNKAFKGSDVVWVKLPEGVTKIGDEAFANCSHLTHVTLPFTLKSIGTKAFYGANVLKYIQTFMTAPIAISANTFSEWTYAKAAVFIPYSTNYSLRTEYENTDEWKKFQAFVTTDDDPYLMTDIANEQGVLLNIFITDTEAKTAVLGTTISNMPAVDIDTKGEVIIPSRLGGYTITEINNAAFRNVRKMTAVTIPQTVTDIGWMGFDGCFGLTDVTVEAKTPFPFSNAAYAFPASVYRNAMLHVPAGSVSAYHNCEGWKEFGNIEESKVLLGDVNSDGKVTPADAIMILYAYFGVDQTGFNPAASDVNRDARVSPADAIEALYLYFGGSSNGARATLPSTNMKEPE
ncbi:MAG: leucine-rich repeat protein [Prevotella sp.]|nr:leucine-rich repeat protein [Prevotella sp.]